MSTKKLQILDSLVKNADTLDGKHANEFASVGDLEGLATETFVTSKIAEAQLGGGDGEVDLSGYATKDDLASKVSKSGDTMTGNLNINKTDPSIILKTDGTMVGRIVSSVDGNGENRLIIQQQAVGSNATEGYYFPAPDVIDTYTGYSLLTSKTPVSIAQGGTGATNAATACKNLGAATVLVGAEIPSNADLNDYTTPGTYRSPSGTISATLSNAPYTVTGFKLEVFNTTSSNQIIQEIKCNAGSARTYRRQASSSNGVWTFNSWYKVMQSAGDALAIGDGGTGATDAASARANLGITPANIGALPTTGGTVAGNISINKGTEYSQLKLNRTVDDVVHSASCYISSTGSARVSKNTGSTSGVNYLDLSDTSTTLGKPLALGSGGTGATNAATARKNIGAASTASYSATLKSTDWSSSAPYSQTVSVSGILATDDPLVYVDMSGATTAAKGIQLTDAWYMVGRVTANAGSITAYCYEEKPTIDVPLVLKVVR